MFKTWTLKTDPEIYKATKTNQYFILNGSKYYIWKHRDTLKPITAELVESASQLPPGPINANFTEKGAKRNPFLFAVKEKENQN